MKKILIITLFITVGCSDHLDNQECYHIAAVSGGGSDMHYYSNSLIESGNCIKIDGNIKICGSYRYQNRCK